MEDDLKLTPTHYYLAIAILSLFLFIFAVDTYNSLTYESPIPEIKIQDYYNSTLINETNRSGY